MALMHQNKEPANWAEVLQGWRRQQLRTPLAFGKLEL